MIISKTPFRISFFGGGTDYPAWYKDNGGREHLHQLCGIDTPNIVRKVEEIYAKSKRV